MIIDAQRCVLGSSDGRGELHGVFPLKTGQQKMGQYQTPDSQVAGFGLTPG